jgi:hypothetical protein
MLDRLPRAVTCAVFAVALVGYGSFAASGEDPSSEAARQEFVRNYIAAIESRDPARVKALTHPQVLACKNFPEYFDLGKETAFKEQPGPGYKVTFTALPGDAKPPLVPPDKFKYPVQPSYQFQIDWSRNAEGTSLVSLIQFIAEKDGAWFLVYPCPNDAGIKLIHEMTAEGRKQKDRAYTLAEQLKDPLKGELLDLLKHDHKIDAINRYRSATGVDLTTAVQVINTLETAPR